MWIWITVILACLIETFSVIGCRRVSILRRASLEGIENNAVVEAYDRINRWPQLKILRKMFIAELKKHQPSGVLADIGCGPGYLIIDLTRSFPNISIKGVDVAEEMLAKARESIASLGAMQKISFHQGDIQQLPFEDGSINFVVSTLSLHH